MENQFQKAMREALEKKAKKDRKHQIILKKDFKMKSVNSEKVVDIANAISRICIAIVAFFVVSFLVKWIGMFTFGYSTAKILSMIAGITIAGSICYEPVVNVIKNKDIYPKEGKGV